MTTAAVSKDFWEETRRAMKVLSVAMGSVCYIYHRDFVPLKSLTRLMMEKSKQSLWIFYCAAFLTI